MLARRLLVIVAILMAVTALTAGLAAPPSERGAIPTPTPRAGAPESELVEREIDASARRPRTVTIASGDELRLTVRASTLDTVHLVGLDLMRSLAPETPAVFDVLAGEPGVYPVELLEAARRVGTVRITPARG